MTGYWPSSFLGIYGLGRRVKVHKLTQLMKILSYGFSGKFFVHNTAGSPEQAIRSILPALLANHSAGFSIYCPPGVSHMI